MGIRFVGLFSAWTSLECTAPDIRGGEISECVLIKAFQYSHSQTVARLVSHRYFSTVFDPNERSDITNPEYVRIHEEYKGLVDFMLGSFMEEMQISAAQFEVACLENRQHQQTATSSSSGNAFSFHQGLFQQIWAANDIRIFVRMMTQRNVELQLQALELIQHRQQNLTDADAGKSDLFQASDNVVADVADDDVDDTPHQLSTNDDTASERQLFESIEKVLRNENDRNTEVENASSDTNHDEVTVEDKFQRLNLFFEKEKVKFCSEIRTYMISLDFESHIFRSGRSIRPTCNPVSSTCVRSVTKSWRQRKRSEPIS